MSESTMPTGLETVLCQVIEGAAQVTLNRPEVHNAFNELMQDELRAVWRTPSSSRNQRTGTGETTTRGDIPETEYGRDPRR